MTVNLKNLRAAVQAFDWAKVFRSVLKWNKPTDKERTETIDNQRFTLTPIADTGGMQVYVVHSADGTLPSRAVRNKLETRLRRVQVEHILIFEDAAQTQAVLQWVKRGQQGRRAREFAYRRGESGEALIQRLQGIAFQIDDFDAQGRIEISKVTARVAKNLDVEQVTKRFYDEFKRRREEFQTFLQGIPVESDQRWYVSVMLNRLMFIYFIQAKGFLNNNTDYLRERLAWSQATLGPDRYYRDFLRTLFFEGFALEPSQRSAEANQKLGVIPYLNGGLFLPHPIEERYGAAIDIPDRAFAQLFTFFSSWRWHLGERPGASDREIDPDVLGYIFEKYINQKQMGAYYTREDITGYICRNTIIPALFDKASLSIAPLNLPQTISAYIYPAMKQEEFLPTETEREYAARRARVAALIADAKAGKIATINDAVTANLDLEEMIEDLIPKLDATKLYSLYTALAGDPKSGKLPLSVLDPTVGSGAFLFAALRILKPIYEAVLDRMDELVEKKQAAGMPLRDVLAAAEAHPNRDYFITKSIVVRNLYGVDIMAEATEICKLRLFLRMVADLDDPRHIEPLPDIDFNIRAGNSLVGYARPEEIGLVYKGTVAAPSPRQQRLLEEIRTVQRELTVYRDAQLQYNPSSAEGRAARQAIRERLDVINAELDRDLLKMGQIHEEPGGGYNTQPFHWFTAFYEILAEGGFDVIVGNPPYLELREVDYKPQVRASLGSGAIHAMCVERSVLLLGNQGHISMILPLSLVSTQRMQVTQHLIEHGRTVWYANYAWRPGKLFDTVNRALTIFVASPSIEPKTYSTAYQKWYSEARDHLMSTQSFIEVPRTRPAFWVPKLGDPIERGILKKCLGVLTRLQDFMSESEYRVYYRTTGGLYWKVFTDFAPIFIVNGQPSSSSRETWFSLSKANYVYPSIAVLSSNLFWWWYTITSNLRDLNPYDVQNFPVPISVLHSEKISELGQAYLENLRANSQMLVRVQKSTGRTETQSFKVQKAKPIIDEIDRALAEHYGFNEEELDFIINYDIKYRMGRDANDGEED